MQPEPRREMITWQEVDKLIDYLLPQFKREFTAMVLITRGGIIPGGMLAEAMNITHILTAAVDFPAQSKTEKSNLMVWPEFIQFPAEDKLRGRPTSDRGRCLGFGADDHRCEEPCLCSGRIFRDLCFAFQSISQPCLAVCALIITRR